MKNTKSKSNMKMAPSNEIGSGYSPKNGRNSLVLKDLFLIYKDSEIDVVAVQGFSATFKSGEISVIMGPSGSGKTSLLKLIGGVLSPSSGEILLNNTKISEMNENELATYRKNKIGFLFQDKNLIPHLTIYENLEFVFDFQKIPNKQKAKRAQSLLKELSLEDRSSHKPTELSGGQNQRAGLAVALANNPEIILTDEPTGELDSKSRNDIIQLFKKTIAANPEKILIIVSHDPEFLSIADQAFFLEDGKIKTQMSSDELKSFRQNIPASMDTDTKTESSITLSKSDFDALKKQIKDVQQKIEKIEATKSVY